MTEIHSDPRLIPAAYREDGRCACGCGQLTSIATQTRTDRGWVKGHPVRWVRGHGRRARVRYIESDTGYRSPCWLWQLSKDCNGYARVAHQGRKTFAHCVYYQQRYGPVPKGLELDHLCRVRCCVNPDHLEPVSHAVNCQRGRRAKLTASQVTEIRASCETQRVIGRRFGISQSHVARIKGGKTWSAQAGSACAGSPPCGSSPVRMRAVTGNTT
jgi:hypothetical protein